MNKHNREAEMEVLIYLHAPTSSPPFDPPMMVNLTKEQTRLTKATNISFNKIIKQSPLFL
jgi:hypothetical protein